MWSESEFPDKAEGDYGYGSPAELGELLNRRDAEEVLAERNRMVTEIITELARLVPGSHWLPSDEEDSTQCAEFGSTKGRVYFSPHYMSEMPIPAALWGRAAQAVIDIAARYGYTDVAACSENATGDRALNLTIRDGDGGRLSFGSMAKASLYVGTGCCLTAEDKRQARAAAPPS